MAMLILPRDQVGPRRLVAEVPGIARAEVPFLVVPPTVKPSGRSLNQIGSKIRLVER
ncbi:MAG TPA: hypothetical protein VGF00_03270 [Acidimicrobiia bacterium]